LVNYSGSNLESYQVLIRRSKISAIDREERRAKKAARKKEREEKAARRAARKKEEKKNGVGPSTIVVSSSSSFDWTTSPVSLTTLSSSFWDSFGEEE
jgi:hypothetical protein